MKRSFIIFILAIVFGAMAYTGTYYLRPTREMSVQPDGEMEWLRHEFHLTDGQFQKIKILHDQYRPLGDEMCRSISASNERLASLIKSNRMMTPEIEAAFAQSSKLQEECQRAMLEHVYQVSRIMNPDQSQRYLEKMQMSIIQPGRMHSTGSREK